MNIKHISFLFFSLLFCILFSSCNDDKNVVDYTGQTNDAQIYSFSLKAPAPISKDSVVRAQDSIRFIVVNETRYAIDQVGGVIYNPDSLPFKTILQKASVKVSFNPIYGVAKVQVETPDSTYTWNTTDSINFSKMPVRFKITSHGNTEKNYDINIRIHKIDPDTILWKQMSSYPNLGKSKTILNNTDFYTYTLSNGAVSLNTSAKGSIAWTNQGVSGLPSNVLVESFTLSNSIFNVIDQAGMSYTSTDGKIWTKQNNGEVITSIFGILPAVDRKDDLLLVSFRRVEKEKDGKEVVNYYFGKGKSLASINIVQKISGSAVNQVPSNFPMTGMASYTNFSTNRVDRMLLLTAGLNNIGTKLTDTWLIKNAEDGIEITPFIKKPIFEGGAGLSTFAYNNLYYALKGNQFYTSSYWGETWVKAPAKQMLDPRMGIRSGQTVIVDSENYIWVFGGISDKGKYLNDVWRGRLNSLIPQ